MDLEKILLEVLRSNFERTHRLIEQDKFDDFEMLEDLHSEWYWQAEREDVATWLREAFGEGRSQEILLAWKSELDAEYKEVLGDD